MTDKPKADTKSDEELDGLELLARIHGGEKELRNRQELFRGLPDVSRQPEDAGRDDVMPRADGNDGPPASFQDDAPASRPS